MRTKEMRGKRKIGGINGTLAVQACPNVSRTLKKGKNAKEEYRQEIKKVREVKTCHGLGG
jgi:hypothetical protein